MEEMTFNEIISYAKIAEDNAKKFYLDAAAIAQQRNVKEFLESLAAEEQAHSDRLEALRRAIHERGVVPQMHEDVRNLGYADYIEPVSLDADATYKDVLEVAMAKEKEAIQNYESFARYVDDEEARKLFDLLAEEERRHLKRFEEDYDDLQNQYY